MAQGVIFSKKLILVNSISGIIVKILNITILVWLQQHLLKRISTDEYSLYPVLMSVMLFMPLLTSIMTSGLSRYVVEAYANNQKEKVTEITSTISLLLYMLGTVVLFFGLVFTWEIDLVLTIPENLVHDARVMMMLLFIDFIMTTVLLPLQVGFHVKQAFVYYNFINLGKEVLRIIILVVLLFGVSTEVLWVVVSTFVANSLASILMVIVSRKMVPSLKLKLSSFKWSIAKELTSFGGWSFLGQAAYLIKKNADVILLNKLSSSIEVTNYFLGSLPDKQIDNFTAMATRPLLPQLTAAHAGGLKTDLKNAYLNGNRLGLWGALLIAFPLIMLSKELVFIWVGDEFVSAAIVGVLLLATYPITYGNIMMGCLAVATAKIKKVALATIFIQGINLILTFILVGRFGMGAVGSALATFMVTIIVQPVLMVPIGLELSGCKFKEWIKRSVIPGWTPVLFSLIILLPLKWWIKPVGLFSLMIYITLGILLYLAILLKFCLDDYDRRNLQKIIGRMPLSYKKR